MNRYARLLAVLAASIAGTALARAQEIPPPAYQVAAQRADIINLREWLVGQMALGDGRHPAEE